MKNKFAQNNDSLNPGVLICRAGVTLQWVKAAAQARLLMFQWKDGASTLAYRDKVKHKVLAQNSFRYLTDS
jgi:hypothetical protein